MRPFLAAISIVIFGGLTITPALLSAQPKGAIVHRTDTLRVTKLTDGTCDWRELTIPNHPPTTLSVLGTRDDKACTLVHYIVERPKGQSLRVDTVRAPRPDSLGSGLAVIYKYPDGTSTTDSVRVLQRPYVATVKQPMVETKPDTNTVTIIRGHARPSASSRRADSISVVDVIRKHLGDRKHTIDRVVVFGDSAAVQVSMASVTPSTMRISYMLDRRKSDALWVKRDREEVVLTHYNLGNKWMLPGKKDTVRAP